jgi:hypothetical protein
MIVSQCLEPGVKCWLLASERQLKLAGQVGNASGFKTAQVERLFKLFEQKQTT